MLDHVTTNYLFKLIISERVWKRSEIVNDVSVTQTVRVDTDRAGEFILATTNVEDLHQASSDTNSCKLIA